MNSIEKVLRIEKMGDVNIAKVIFLCIFSSATIWGQRDPAIVII